MARNPFSQLASLGEEVLGKASHNPAASRVLHSRVVQGAGQLKDRVDDLAKQVRGLQRLEQRLAALEERLAKLEGPPARKPATKRPAAAKRPAPAAKAPPATTPD